LGEKKEENCYNFSILDKKKSEKAGSFFGKISTSISKYFSQVSEKMRGI